MGEVAPLPRQASLRDRVTAGQVRDLAAVSEVLGYEPGESEDMLNDLRRALRQARGAVEEIFRP